MSTKVARTGGRIDKNLEDVRGEVRGYTAVMFMCFQYRDLGAVMLVSAMQDQLCPSSAIRSLAEVTVTTTQPNSSNEQRETVHNSK